MSLVAIAPAQASEDDYKPLTITGERTYSFDAKYPTADPCVVNQKLLNRTSTGGTTCTGDLEADGANDVLEFTNWHWDTFFSPDIGLNLRDTLPAGSIADPAGDSFKFTSFTTEVFSCGVPISFEVVGYEDGSQVGSQSFNLVSASGVTTRIIGFASVDEVRFENYSDSNANINSCMTVDDIVVDQAVSSNTQPSFSGLDATVVFDEAAGTAVAIDANATVSDAELDGLGDYAGSTLTVAREGGANGDDDFGLDTTGASFSLSGSDLLSGGSVFASLTESGGTLTVNFNSNATTATPALADEVLQSLTYANTGSPVVVEYGVTLFFDDGGLQTAQSLPVEYDPVLAPVMSNTTWDFTELGPPLSDKERIDARIVPESTFELLFYGFQFGDAAENSLIASNELQLDQSSSDPLTTGTQFKSDAPFSLEQIDIDNFSSLAQDVEVHAYLDGSLVGSRSFAYGAENGYQTEQFASSDTVFAKVDEIRFTTSDNESVAIDNIVVDQSNELPSLDLDTGAAGDGATVVFSENADQGTALSDGVGVTGPAAANDPDGTIESATLTLDNPQGDVGEGLSIDTASLAGALTFSTSAYLITITRNSATNAELIEAIETVRYQNNSDTPDTTARSITVEATDDGGATASATATVSIEPGNDPPAVSLTPTSGTIAENSGSPATVSQINIDDDMEDGSENNLSLSGPDAADFAINGSALEFTASADFEAKDTYSVTVDVDDPAVGSTPDDSANFTLNISDIDETPIFSATGPFSVSESDTNGTAVGDVDATDGDGGATDANLNYAIVGGNTPGAFAIEGNSGAITVADANAVDFDASPTFSLSVEADDGTNAPTTTVTVNVTNAAPSTPVDSDGTANAVAEDAANGSAVGVTADASDPGGGNVSYALTDTAGGRFQINTGTGIVTVADASLIDFESATSHTISVQASDDEGADSGTASFTIGVTDVDSPPEFTATGPFAVSESAGETTGVGDVDANDGDAGAADDNLVYAITGGNGGGAFAIENNGLITVADASLVDFETSASFALTVEADDGGSTTSASVTVNVTDEPPALPSDTDGAADTVAEDAANGDPVGIEVTSSDPAGGTVTYALTDDAGGRFAIDASGLVTVAEASAIDFENATSHALAIEARDADGTASDTLSVTVTVTDVLEAPVVTPPPDLTVDASGLFTEVDLERDGAATAEDDEDGSLTPTPENVTTPTWLRPGTHAITWSATDSDGATTTAIQVVEIRPRVGIGPDRTVQEGTAVSVPIEMNGEAIGGTTPSIDFDVASTGTAGPTDYAGLAAPGTISIIAGDTGTIGFDVLAGDAAGEGPETLVIELTGTGGETVLAERTQVTITIVEDNVAPQVSLKAAQGGNDPAVVIDGSAGANLVTLTADTVDATTTDNMTFAWSGDASGLTDTDGVPDDETFVFDPTIAMPGVYDIEVTATDQGTPQRSGNASLRLRVADPFPALGSGDTDSDGTPDNDPSEGRPDRDGDALPDYRDPYDDRNTVHAALADATGFRLETEPGLALAIGRVAFGVDGDGSRVSAADITSVTGLTDTRPNIGGYFDFRVGGLPTVGASIDVVVPQRAEIPADPVYRKIDAGGQWADFVENGQNAVSSATGAPGFCPPPDDAAYTAGLTSGDWCVRLTIADGGPNDADGQPNARIVDPGGVAEAIVPPTITNAPTTSVQQDATYEYIPQVDDPDPGDSATFSISGQPGWAAFNTATGALTGTPGNADVGLYENIEITVTDSYGATGSTGPFSIEVANVNDPPTIGGNPAGQVAEDTMYSFTPTASDIDVGDSLSFSVTGRPAWATFDPVDGTLSGTPANADVGVYDDIGITALDTAGASDTLGPFSIEVTSVNDAPILSDIGDQTTEEDVASVIDFTVDDVDNPVSELTLSLSNDSPALIDSSTFSGLGTQRSLELVPTPDASGTVNVTVSVSDGSLQASESFTFDITPVNDPPVIVSALSDVVVPADGRSVTLDVQIEDVDTPLEELSVTAVSNDQSVLPDEDISVSGSGGERHIELTPDPTRSGSTQVEILVSDGSDTVGASFGVTVRRIAVPGLSWHGMLLLAALLAIFGAAVIRR